MALQISDKIAVQAKVSNIDNKYGPYENKTAALNKLVNTATNGLTVGIWTDNTHVAVEEYVFVNIINDSTPTVDNLIRKVGTLSITQNGQTTTYNLNNGDVTIALSGTSWNDISGKPENLVQDASYVHTDNNFTTAEKNKLSGIATGAQVNVKPNWNAAAGTDAEILNKPDLSNVVYFEDVN